ncbi:hypothetical protein L2E82_05587 [Cichorium intybus]|uniref:Uncharacterized protein n=1 Tax=Cichorium intybus TaxID=13427 RepID=A0ACB9H8S3_CICIN|nr:hypothetical protein L2E82_05587 [Cichorium intybus]
MAAAARCCCRRRGEEGGGAATMRWWSLGSVFALNRKKDRAVRTGRHGDGRNKAATTAADDRRPGDDGAGALAAVDVADENLQKGARTSVNPDF